MSHSDRAMREFVVADDRASTVVLPSCFQVVTRKDAESINEQG